MLRSWRGDEGSKQDAACSQGGTLGTFEKYLGEVGLWAVLKERYELVILCSYPSNTREEY